MYHEAMTYHIELYKLLENHQFSDRKKKNRMCSKIKYRMACFFLQMNAMDESIQNSTESIELDFENAKAYYIRARAYNMKEDYESSKKDCAKAQKHCDEDDVALCNQILNLTAENKPSIVYTFKRLIGF